MPIPAELRVHLIVGAAVVLFTSYVLEHSLRQLFPAAKPSQKGYLVHGRELARLKAVKARDKKGQ